MFLRIPYRILAMLLVFLLGGCADAMMDDQPMMMAAQPIKNYTEIVKGYGQTLTEAQKKAVITELEEDRERQKEARLP